MSRNDSNEKSRAEASTAVAVGKRKGLGVKRSLFRMCESCQLVDIEPPQPHFTLFCSSTNTSARNCHICAGCFSKCSSDRHCQTFLVCPVCKSQCRQWTVNYTETIQTPRGTVQSSSASHTSEEIEPPDETQDPVDSHAYGADAASPSVSDRHVGSQDSTASSPSTAGFGTAALRSKLKESILHNS
jgi:hypothetical protein